MFHQLLPPLLQARLIQEELDRARNSTAPFMDSQLLHAVPQRFPTEMRSVSGSRFFLKFALFCAGPSY